MSDLQLPLWRTWGLQSSTLLHSIEWLFHIDVSGQPTGPIFKGQEIQEDGTDRLYGNVGDELPF
jgi:hypothetical protein